MTSKWSVAGAATNDHQPHLQARAILCRADDIISCPPGQGVSSSAAEDDRVLGFVASTATAIARVERSRRRAYDHTAKYEGYRRGGKGRELMQRGHFTRIIPTEIEKPHPPVYNPRPLRGPINDRNRAVSTAS